MCLYKLGGLRCNVNIIKLGETKFEVHCGPTQFYWWQLMSCTCTSIFPLGTLPMLSINDYFQTWGAKGHSFDLLEESYMRSHRSWYWPPKHGTTSSSSLLGICHFFFYLCDIYCICAIQHYILDHGASIWCVKIQRIFACKKYHGIAERMLLCARCKWNMINDEI